MVIHDLSHSNRLTINRGCREQSTFKNMRSSRDAVFTREWSIWTREFIYGLMEQKNVILY